MVGGERPRQARDRGLGGVVLQVAAAGDDGTHGGDVDDGAAFVAYYAGFARLNFATPPAILREIVTRMGDAVRRR